MAQSMAYDSNAGQWPRYSRFEALKPNSKDIRLLQLEGNGGTADLRYTMRHEDSSSTTFSALSYSWGAPVPNATLKGIFIEEELVLIRPTLHSFLDTLAKHDPSMCLWIDAVCINQSDTEERNQQISMMGEIFASAHQVYVWLGLGDDDTNYVFEHIGHSDPQTPFDQRQFSPCAEKLFRSSYWTRRWVIQEFALARKLFIVCGQHLTTWQRVTEKIDDKVLENDDSAVQTLENFKQLKALGDQQQLSLLKLMLRFQEARCIDRRDKAFALRGIAKDGSRLQADYKESVTDVYFRILSLLPTKKVLPRTRGYRWPHQAASQLQQCLLMNENDVLTSLQDKPSDKLFTVYEYIGEVFSSTDTSPSSGPMYAKAVQLSGPGHGDLVGSEGVNAGDMVYSIQSSPRSPTGVYIAFKPDCSVSTISGMVVDERRVDVHLENGEVMEHIIAAGVARCYRNATARSSRSRIICHTSRLTLVFLWLLDRGQERRIYDFLNQNTTQLPNEVFRCRCHDGSSEKSQLKANMQDSQGSHLEILPNYSATVDDQFWSASNHPMWAVTGQEPLRERRQPLSIDSKQPNFLRYGRTDLSYAAEDGHVSWVKQFLNDTTVDINVPDNNRRTPLSWAASGRREQTMKLLLESGRVDHNFEDWNKWTPLTWAIKSGYKRGVELLIAVDEVDPNARLRSERTPLSWAAQEDNVGIVKALLATGKVIPDAEDVDRMTPFLWAARYGFEKVMELLLATNKVNYNKKDLSGRSALSYAAEGGFTGIVKLLLAQDNIEPDLRDNDRKTPLRHAAQNKHTKIFKLLLASGKVDFNFTYEYDDSEED